MKKLDIFRWQNEVTLRTLHLTISQSKSVLHYNGGYMFAKSAILFLLSHLIAMSAFAVQTYEATIDLKKMGIGQDVYLLQVTTELMQTAAGDTKNYVWEQNIPETGEVNYLCDTDSTFTIGVAHVRLINQATGVQTQAYDLPAFATVIGEYEVNSMRSPCHLYWSKKLSQNTPLYFEFQPIPVGTNAMSLEWYLGPVVTVGALRSGNGYKMNTLGHVASDISVITHYGIPTSTSIIPMSEH